MMLLMLGFINFEIGQINANKMKKAFSIKKRLFLFENNFATNSLNVLTARHNHGCL